MQDEQNKTDAQPVEVERKPYTSPELVEYGSVEELTKENTGTNTDFVGGSTPR